MTVHERFAAALTRIATATSVRRTRTADHVRDENHSDPEELTRRIVASSAQLERTAYRILDEH